MHLFSQSGRTCMLAAWLECSLPLKWYISQLCMSTVCTYTELLITKCGPFWLTCDFSYLNGMPILMSMWNHCVMTLHRLTVNCKIKIDCCYDFRWQSWTKCAACRSGIIEYSRWYCNDLITYRDLCECTRKPQNIDRFKCVLKCNSSNFRSIHYIRRDADRKKVVSSNLWVFIESVFGLDLYPCLGFHNSHAFIWGGVWGLSA